MKTLLAAAAALALVAALGAGQAEVRLPDAKYTDLVRSPGKAQAPVQMRHRLSATPAVGVPLTLELVFAVADGDAVKIEAAADAQLGAQRISRRVARDDLVTMQLLPGAEGRFYVTVVATIGNRTGANSRVLTVPVQVGKGAPVRAGKQASETPQGELLIRMESR